MNIGIDIDDTLTDTRVHQIAKWKEYIKLYPNPNYTDELPISINEFGIEYINNFWDLYREYLSFETNFKEYCSLILYKLIEDGHKISVVTSRPDYKYNNLKDNLRIWFKQNNIPINVFYTDVQNKGLFCYENNIDLLIDDSLNHINSAKYYGIKTILFNQDEDYQDLWADNWLDVYTLIKRMK